MAVDVDVMMMMICYVYLPVGVEMFELYSEYIVYYLGCSHNKVFP